MEIYAVIMAGGVGSRFWPRSTKSVPKQLLKIFGENTMIQDTVNRLDGIVEKDNILIVTNKLQVPKLKEQLPELPEKNIIVEPFGKNTAPCVGLAAVIVEHMNPEAVMLTLPADHLIVDTKKFQKTIKKAAKYAYESKGLVTIGIKPTRPETGYGYIQLNDEDNGEIKKVKTFAEKPNIETAKRFIEAGDFVWNSGMFIWRADAIIDEMKTYMAETIECIQELKTVIDTDKFDEKLVNVYGQLKSISIDYGIMEKSRKVHCISGNFDWNDVGSWEAVYQLSDKDKDGNAVIGDTYLMDTSNSYIYSPDKFVAAIGLEDLLIINSKDALLVGKRENAQDVKQVVDYLKMNEKSNLT